MPAALPASLRPPARLLSIVHVLHSDSPVLFPAPRTRVAAVVNLFSSTILSFIFRRRTVASKKRIWMLREVNIPNL